MSPKDKIKDKIKNKVKNFSRAILSIPIGVGLAIAFIISSPIILIISIIDLISEFLVTFPSKKNFIESSALEKELERFRDQSLPSYNEITGDSNPGNLPELSSAEKKQVAYRRNNDQNDQDAPTHLFLLYQRKDPTIIKLLYGCHKLDYDASDTAFGYALLGKESAFANVIERIKIISKIFLYLFLRALEAMGFPYDALQNSQDEYKEEIEGAFDSLKSKALILLNRSNRSTIKKEVTDSLYSTILDYVISLTENDSSYFDHHSNFVLEAQRLIVSPEDNDKYEKINKNIVEKLVKVFMLLMDAKLCPEHNSLSEEKFNTEFYNLMRSVNYGDPFSQCTGYTPQSKMTLPGLGDADVEDLKEKLSCFVDNLLENSTISNLSLLERRNYIRICCEKVLRAYIDYGSVFGGKSPETCSPLGYDEHAENIATHLSNDIVKTLNFNELIKIHKNKENNCTYNIKELVRRLLPRDSITAGLYGPMSSIVGIIRRNLGKDKPTQKFSSKDMSPPGEMLHKSASTSSLKSVASSRLPSRSDQNKDML